MAIRDRIKELRRVKASELQAHPKNWRVHPQFQRDAMAELLGEIGYAGALIARETPDGALILIDGHLRAETTPDDMVPVLVLDVTEAEADKLLVTLDPLASMATRDDDALASLLDEIQSDGAVKDMLDALAVGETAPLPMEEDDARTGKALRQVEVDDYVPTSERGQVWALGDHRLMCGDATSPEDVTALTGDDNIESVLTDPPFTFGLASTLADRAKAGSWHDLMNSAQWFSGIYRGAAAVIKNDGPMWFCTSWRMLPVVMRAAAEAKMGIQSVVVWDKGWIGPGGNRGLRPSYEMVALITLGNYGVPNRGIADVWHFPWSSHKPSGHNAEKPVGLFEKCLEVSERTTVYDPFVGSGTTLIAAEKLSRRCYAMEIEPRYVDVAIRRWEDFTGRKAELLSG